MHLLHQDVGRKAVGFSEIARTQPIDFIQDKHKLPDVLGTSDTSRNSSPLMGASTPSTTRAASIRGTNAWVSSVFP